MAHFEDWDYDDDRREEERQREVRAVQEANALADPAQDFYDLCPPKEPKREIGEYVATQGFSRA